MAITDNDVPSPAKQGTRKVELTQVTETEVTGTTEAEAMETTEEDATHTTEAEATQTAEPEVGQTTEPDVVQTTEPEVAQTADSIKTESNGRAPNEASPTRRPPHPKSHPIYQTLWTWLLPLLTIALFLLTVLYALGNIGILDIPSIRLSISLTILVLRVLSEATGLCMISLIDGSLEKLQCVLAARENGIALPGLLALGLGTGKLGMMNLLFRGFRGGKRWSLLRLSLVLGVPAMGIIILSRVNVGLDFKEYASFPVAAGLGDFDASNVEQWREIAALQVTTDFKNLLQNPQLAVRVPPLVTDRSSCFDSDIFAGQGACGVSYFVHGGVPLVTPPVVKNSTLPDAYVYLIKNMQGMQLDFNLIAASSLFDEATDCIVAGNGRAAVQFCISTSDGTTIDAKFVHCPMLLSRDSSCLTDPSWQSSPGWNTSLTIHRRTADIHFSRYNFTTVLISNLSRNPTSVSIPPSSLLHVFNVTFSGNALGFSSNTPGQQFIFYLSSFLAAAAASSSFGSLEARLYLRNLLALPLYYYQPTYLSDAAAAITEDNVNMPNPALPAELYTQAAFAAPSYRVQVARWSVWIYAVGGAVTIAVCVAVLVLGSLVTAAGRVPELSLWPALDFATGYQVLEDQGKLGSPAEEDQRESEGEASLKNRLVNLRGLGWRDEAREMGRIRVIAVSPAAQ